MERIKLADTAKTEVAELLAKLNIKQQALCQIVAPGKNVNYLSACLSEGTMPEEMLNMLITLGCDRIKLVAAPEPEPAEDIRKAVTNGIMDAWLIIQKQEQASRKAMLKALIEDIMDDEELKGKIQFLMFQSIDGALAKRSNGTMHNGLVPQKW